MCMCVMFWCFHAAIPEDMIQEPEPTEDDPEDRIPRECIPACREQDSLDISNLSPLLPFLPLSPSFTIFPFFLPPSLSFSIFRFYLPSSLSFSLSLTERLQDKRISRDDELSDSDDEGDGRRNETAHHRDTKRARVSVDRETNKPSIISKAMATTGGNEGAIQSPVPPEPSPITPGPLTHAEEAGSSENKSEWST